MKRNPEQDNFGDFLTCVAIVTMFASIMLMISTSCSFIVSKNKVKTQTECQAAYDYFTGLGCDELLTVPGPDEIAGTDDDIDWVVFCERFNEMYYTSLNLSDAMQLTDCNEIAQVL